MDLTFLTVVRNGHHTFIPTPDVHQLVITDGSLHRCPLGSRCIVVYLRSRIIIAGEVTSYYINSSGSLPEITL